MSNSAIREYAKRLVDAVKDADLCDFIYGSDFCKSCMYNPMCKAARDCESALAAPLKNCEVGTADEQFERWRVFCEKYDDDCTGCPCDGHPNCYAAWAAMPYEEGGAK